ncbi:hypothetical protein [Mumia zhuanghuii]|uniref:PucR C-terminal helix-turn-helix domain-containing protein n=1 Tax=Mumia zhuanghuii TaxID=2585211 RepID=A0A5C4MG54_9ACTN|nr:hypothetical protein [Mumia zhuanghuii]TNC36553.1 hypothetical protein FHE65_25940 [Mumia zhuanghuii]TNC42498.1 hypothetical protein FHE65_20965 [Mumia zhuanghuii]
MTLVAPENPAHLRDAQTLPPLSKSRRQVLQRQIWRAAVGGVNSELRPAAKLGLQPVVSRAIDAFLTCNGSSSLASTQVRALVEGVGRDLALLGGSPQDIDAAFAAARAAVDRGLPLAVAGDLAGPGYARLRRNLADYLTSLHKHIREAYLRMRRTLDLTDEERMRALTAALFRDGSDRNLPNLLAAAGLDPNARLVPVVAVSAPLPSTLLVETEVIAAAGPYEALVPAAWSDADLCRQLGGTQVVVAPPTAAGQVAEGAALARRGAAVLRDGTTEDERQIVPCADLAGSLLVGAHPLLTELVIDKRLGVLADTGPRRRVQLGEFLLAWLQHGVPIARLATIVNVKASTAHSRMQVIREIFGDELEDPMARIELIVGLHAALPRWRIVDQNPRLQKNL